MEFFAYDLDNRLFDHMRIDKAEWDALDLVSRWLIASRAAVLVMTAVTIVQLMLLL